LQEEEKEKVARAAEHTRVSATWGEELANDDDDELSAPGKLTQVTLSPLTSQPNHFPRQHAHPSWQILENAHRSFLIWMFGIGSL